MMLPALNKEELIARLEEPINFQMIAHLTGILENHRLEIADLLEISFHKKKEVAFRAAWILEYLMVNRPAEFALHIPSLLLLLPKQKNYSAMRHYSKIVALLTAKGADIAYKNLRQELDFEPVAEALFTWLVEPEMPVAIKVHCMQSLANLVPRYEWLREELLETVNYLVDVESIAFFARAKMVRKQLNRKNS